MQAISLSAGELVTHAGHRPLELDSTGRPAVPLAFVQLDGTATIEEAQAAATVVNRAAMVVIGVARPGVSAVDLQLAAALDFNVMRRQRRKPAAPEAFVSVDDLDDQLSELERLIFARPYAAVTLVQVLRRTTDVSLALGLELESFAYSTLLAGREFSQWRTARRPDARAPTDGPEVVISRNGPLLEVQLNRPRRHNAFSRGIRDGLVEAFDLAALDDSITSVHLHGAGPSFCSGGDLDEFGTATDATLAHLIRLDRSVARRVDCVRDKTRVTLHGACIGAGIEVPSFAGRIDARSDAFFLLPELSMGLIPGAGGTVGITRRIGRWRTAYMALSGQRINVDTALEWGLVDARVSG